MKRLGILSIFTAAVMLISSCSGIYTAEIYVDPYMPLTDNDLNLDECSISFGDGVSVNGQGAWYKGNDIIISKGGVYKLSGCYSGGRINITTSDAVKLILANASISAPDDDYAIVSSAERLIIASDGKNTLKGQGGDFCNAVYSNGNVLIAGNGEMCIDGGIISRGNIRFGNDVAVLCEILKTDKGDVIIGTLDVK